MFYQANPLYAVIVIILFLGLYLLYKRRKGTRMHGGGSTLFSGRASQQNDLVDLIMVQQFINSSKNNNPNNKGFSPEMSSESTKREAEIENIKKEVLSLFD